MLLKEIIGWKDILSNDIQAFGGQCEVETFFITPMMCESFMYYIRLMFFIVIDRLCTIAFVLENHPQTTARNVSHAKDVWASASRLEFEMKMVMETITEFDKIMYWNGRLISSLQMFRKELSLMNTLLVPSNNVIGGWGIFVLFSENQPFLPPSPDQLAVQPTSCFTVEIERRWAEESHLFYQRVLVPLHQDDWKIDHRKRQRPYQEDEE